MPPAGARSARCTSRSRSRARSYGETISGRELTLEPLGSPAIDVLLSAAPILSRDGDILGSVVSFVDITERKRLASERLALLEGAQAARAEAEAASRAKDDFLAMLGHELRNPLAPILTALELMRAQTTEVPHEREIIERQVKHVVALVDDLLDVSRITQGKVELDRRAVELAPIVARAIELAGPLIEERGHQLDVDVAATGMRLAADETRIAQVISNLLVNAAKYTERNGQISLRATGGGAGGDDIVLVVRDNGMGIPPDILPHLFERFVQGERTIDRAEGGLGLGLAIVSSLVALHGGTVAVESAGVGHGSSFEIRLPGLSAEAEREAAARAPSIVAPERTEPSRGAGSAHRVLVVDDNVDAADLLAEALEQLGHATRVAYDGHSALEVAAEFRPDVAVLDIGLPVMDGFELAQRMRQATTLPDHLHLIALTGYGQDSDRRRSSDAGFDFHLIKPVDLSVLVRTIRRLTEPTASAAGG
jgi:signal transduction histidine kinase/ActR/RegA family two-component response regulator